MSRWYSLATSSGYPTSLKTSRYLPYEKTRPSILPSERSPPFIPSTAFSRAGLSEVLTLPSQMPNRSLPLTASGTSIWMSLGVLKLAESWSSRLSATF